MSRPVSIAALALMAVLATGVEPAAQTTDDQEADQDVGLPGLEVLGDDAWLISTSVTTATLASAYGLYAVRLGEDDLAAVELYLRNHGRTVQRDLHLGGGETIRDLARLLDVGADELEAFGRLLYDRRDRLVELAAPMEVDRRSARRFVEIVTAEMALRPGFDGVGIGRNF